MFASGHYRRGSDSSAGTSANLVDDLAGRIWSTTITGDGTVDLRRQHLVLTTRLKAGHLEVRVLADEAPAGMTPATATLEDVYFATLHQHGLNTSLE